METVGGGDRVGWTAAYGVGGGSSSAARGLLEA
jgi:hypothetical protein